MRVFSAQPASPGAIARWYLQSQSQQVAMLGEMPELSNGNAKALYADGMAARRRSLKVSRSGSFGELGR